MGKAKDLPFISFGNLHKRGILEIWNSSEFVTEKCSKRGNYPSIAGHVPLARD